MKVKIPFAMRFKEPMLEETKISTTRFKKMACQADFFEAFGYLFCVDEVKQVYLYRVARLCHKQEGFNSEHDFIEWWKQQYPQRGYRPNDLVYYHRFFIETKADPDGTEGKRTAKSKRCFHRVMSGIARGGQLRFLTLTSSDNAPDDIERSWRALYMRMVRRGLIHGYIKVPEQSEDGRQHLHILFRGSYIQQVLIKQWWSEIHQSDIVDIRALKVYGKPKAIASYMAKYMSKELAGRYSWSWGWVWRGFCKDWSLYKKWWWRCVHVEGKNSFSNCIVGWNMWLKGLWQPDCILMQLELESGSHYSQHKISLLQEP